MERSLDRHEIGCRRLNGRPKEKYPGLRNRKVSAHRLNEHSSRSHGLMTVYVESHRIDPDDQRIISKKGKICFVDLAGSEKVKESRATGDTLVETLKAFRPSCNLDDRTF
jgi:hypothetical protein